MTRKQLLLLGAAPFALAALYGGSVAFAQSGEPSPSATPEQTAPADPTPGTNNGGWDKDCPGKDGSGSSDGSQSSTNTQVRRGPRAGQVSSSAY